MENTNRYMLIPQVAVAKYASEFYLYDAQVTKDAILRIPTQKIQELTYDVICKLRAMNLELDPQTEEILHQRFRKDLEKQTVTYLIDSGYLEDTIEIKKLTQIQRQDHQKSDDSGRKPSSLDQMKWELKFFTERQKNHYFRPSSFFNLPYDLDDSLVEVGFVGLPVASTLPTIGTESAPKILRDMSQIYNGLEIYRCGIYSEIDCNDSLPEVLCKEIAVKDYGDLISRGETVQDLINALDSCLKKVVFKHGFKPIFIGGDHAITFPILNGLSKKYKEFQLVHLDGHNDLLFTPHVKYNHAAMVRDVVGLDSLKNVLSFGLRTFLDERTPNLDTLKLTKARACKVHPYSLGHTKQLIADTPALRRLLQRYQGIPCYLSIDLDVLSSSAINSQLSTPMGHGLEWYELFTLVQTIHQELDLVGCDVVEFNQSHNQSQFGEPSQVVALLLLLIDALGKKSAKKKKQPRN